MQYEPIIGLEVHVELKTKSKMFCGCPADYFGKEPNSQTCPVCLGLPGALPVPNRKAVEWTILLGLSLNCQINLNSKFDRKNYFYPDLPKGYQISQYDQPIAIEGELGILKKETPSEKKSPLPAPRKIRIRRVHLEEDTGKLLHSHQIPNYGGPPNVSLIDFNRSGVPLVEIVTEPDFRSSEEAKEFLRKIQLRVRYLGISDADMEKGSMRIEPSVSLRETEIKNQKSKIKISENNPNYRVEIKNVNSFRFAQKAIDYEINRQKQILEGGGGVKQETRGWNETKGQTVGQRTKEEAHDYRYFPEPDIPPLEFTKTQISEIRRQLPELPEAKIEKYVRRWGLKSVDAEIIVSDLVTARYFEEAARLGRERGTEPQKIASLIVNGKIDIETTTPIQLIESLERVGRERGSMGPGELAEICVKIIEENSQAVSDYRHGKKQSLQFLLGRALVMVKGKAEPNEVLSLLESLLNSS